MEAKPEDLDAVLERWVPASSADVGTAHMEAPVDREVLARLRGLQGDKETDFVAELAGVFLEDARWGLQEVEEALQRGDAPAVERVAHKLKGGSGSMGARGCPASTRSWKTSAHQEISRKAPNYSDESGRSWGGSSGR